MSDFNCDCSPTYPNGAVAPIPPFWGFSAFTPTIPKLYWNVKSQEQRILNLFDLLNKLVCYCDSMGLQIDVNAQDIANLKREIQELKDGSLLDYYEKQIYDWIQANMADLISAGIKQVYFGLTSDGYFCAYVPDSWSDITFDTGAVYGTETYGRLILRFDSDGSGVIDNRYDSSVLTDTIDARLKSVAGRGLEFDNDKLNVNKADAITFGGVKLKHDVDNDVTDEWAVTSDGVYSYAPSKSETTDQPTDLNVYEAISGVHCENLSVHRTGKLAMVIFTITVDDGITAPKFRTLFNLPSWCGSGHGIAIYSDGTLGTALCNSGRISITKDIVAPKSADIRITVNYNG